VETVTLDADLPGASPYVLALRQACENGSGKHVTRFEVGELEVEVRAAGDSLWAFIRRAGQGGLALRAAHLPGAFTCTKASHADAASLRGPRHRTSNDPHGNLVTQSDIASHMDL
jgi:hypothetical protein